jgi:hypothetical protein
MPTFRNTTGLTITDATGNQTGFRPVSQTVAVSGVGVVNSVAVTFTGFTHATPVDLDFVLVAPDGSNLVFLSDAGWYVAAANQTLTFADTGAAQAPSGTVLVNGTTYKPTNLAIGLNETEAQFGLPGGPTLRNPAGSDSFANAFNGVAGDGVWTLYAVDDANGDTGTISGWILTINGPDIVAAPAPPPPPPPTVAPTVAANFSNVVGDPGFGLGAVPATVTTPTGQVLPNPLLEQQKAIAALIARVDAGQLTLRQAQDLIVDMADGTTSVAAMSYQFFTGKLPTQAGLDYLVSSPQNPNDLNDGYYAGMSLENRYINFAVNLGKLGEGSAQFAADYGALSLSDATAKAYALIFGVVPTAQKLSDILTPARTAYLGALGGDALGQKAAMVGFLLGEAAKSDLGPYAVRNENFLYDLLDGTAAFGADAHIYDNAGPSTGLVGVA